MVRGDVLPRTAGAWTPGTRGRDLEAVVAGRGSARLWFSLYERDTGQALYTYQLPSAGGTGASKRVLGGDLVEFSSYSCLGLNGHRRIVEATQCAVDEYGTSSAVPGCSRAPQTDLHIELEAELAAVIGQDAAATFASGFGRQRRVVTALCGPADHVLLDQYAHRSLADAVRLAGCSSSGSATTTSTTSKECCAKSAHIMTAGSS